MRKLLLLGICMLWACAGIARAPFAIDENIEGQKYSLWNTLLKGETIFVYLETINILDDEIEEYKTFIKSGMNSWFTDTARIIKESGRAEEFMDILPILEQGIRIEFHKQPADFWNILVFIYGDMGFLGRACNSSRALACAQASSATIPSIKIFSLALADRTEMNWEGIFVHEFGHLLGLNDQYNAGVIERALPGGSSSAVYPEDTVMYDAMNFIGCDDVDGIINLIDVRRGGAQGTRKGIAWKSFCEQSKDYFKDGKRI